MSLGRSHISVTAMLSVSVITGLAVAESSGATTSLDTVVESTVADTPDSTTETSIATTPSAAVEILPPDESWDGLNRGDWLARKYQWMFSMPADVGPFYDSTGGRCGYGQSGPIFFVMGADGPETSEVTCVVAEGTAIYVVPASINCSTVEPPPFFRANRG
jgi:hypothetical protein